MKVYKYKFVRIESFEIFSRNNIMGFIFQHLISSLFVYAYSAASVGSYGISNGSAPLGVTKNGTCESYSSFTVDSRIC